MLAIRLKRTGRSGHSQFRLIAQDSRFSPKGGRVVAYLGSYDPHTKVAQLDTDKIVQFIDNGAQPSDSAAKLLRKEGIKLPDWVKTYQPKDRSVRNVEKRRSTRPAEAEAPVAAEPEAPAEETAAEEAPTETAEQIETEEATAAPSEPETPAESEPKPEPAAEPQTAEEKTEAPAEQN